MERGVRSLFVGTLLIVLVFSEAGEYHDCRSTQYLKLSMPGLVNCGFEEGFFGVFWYNSSDYIDETPFLYFQSSQKSGRGYSSGEFDIFPNGSLIVNEVSMEHDHNFTVIKVETITHEPVPIHIHVVVTVEPPQLHPIIKGCENRRICFEELEQGNQPACHVRSARPAVQVSWFIRTLEGDREVDSETSVSSEGLLYSTSVNALYSSTNRNDFVVLVCKEISLPSLLKESEAVVVLETASENVSSTDFALIYTKYGSILDLVCSVEPMLYLAWTRGGVDETPKKLVHGLLDEEPYYRKFTNEYEIGSTGALIARDVGLQLEGLYTCIYGDGFMEHETVFNVVVFVPPVPAYPLIDGCSHFQYCVLPVEQDSVLTCSLRGIRPSVELKWSAADIMTSNFITFSNQQLKIVQKNNIFDIILTSRVYIHHKTEMHITVECKVLGYNFTSFDLSTKLDLLYIPDPVSTPSEGILYAKDNRMLKVTVSIAIIAVVSAVTLFCFYRVRHNRINSSLRSKDYAENVPMIFGKEEGTETTDKTPKRNNEQKSSLLEDKARKKQIFTDQLKRRYVDMCEYFVPVPFLPERKYRIDEIFVESGIDIWVSKSGKENTWQKLDSYRNILSSRNNSMRILLEGDPGFGKSTISLQMAYDWCTQKESTGVFILLKLRDLASTDSFFQAIKSSLLPLDSALSEEDVESIVTQSTNVTIVLDGFDKYPEGSNYDNTVVKRIMMNKILINAVVILTTRPSCLPTECHSTTIRIRLTGFDEDSQEEYVNKVIKSSEKDISVFQTIIRNLLQENPVLNAICEVPLFFVHLVHITHGDNISASGFPTVTSFFSNVIKCFDSYTVDHFANENAQSVPVKIPRKFDELIFNGLLENERIIFWEKHTFVEKLGNECYNHYRNAGLFYEEDVEGGLKTKVRFYHNIFCEWFAALHLSRLGEERKPIELEELLKRLRPVDVQYVYRFACGLSACAAEKIIKYLDHCKDGQKFAILCIMEQEKLDTLSEKFVSTVTSLCQSPISISSHESRILHVSTLELLKIASSLEIPIKLVWLTDMNTTTDSSNQRLQFSSGLFLDKIDTLLQLSIGDVGRTFSNDELISTLHYVTSCSYLNTVRFRGCILPLAIDHTKLPQDLLRRKLTVEWSPLQKNRWYRLNLQTGHWELERKPLKEKEYTEITTRVRSLWKTPSSTHIDVKNSSTVSPELAEYLGRIATDQPDKLQEVVQGHCLSPINMSNLDDLNVQRAIIELLKVASECKIHIECVWLRNMSCVFTRRGLKLRSQLILPELKTLNQLSILDQGRIFSEDDFSGILNYASLCPALSNLRFRDCMMPQSIAAKSIVDNVQKRNLLVEWKLTSNMEASYHLNLYSGKWEFEKRELTNKEYGEIVTQCNLSNVIDANGTSEKSQLVVPMVVQDYERGGGNV